MNLVPTVIVARFPTGTERLTPEPLRTSKSTLVLKLTLFAIKALNRAHLPCDFCSPEQENIAHGFTSVQKFSL